MDSIHLSPRLAAVASFVPKGARLADIGSDHAYLPANLLINNKISFAIAGEVAKGPYENAQHEIVRKSLTTQLEARLANGLAAIKDEDHIDTVTIAGMGGVLITDILEAGFSRAKHFETLILQPNTDEHVVRTWLNNHQYKINDEVVEQEDNHFYEIMIATKGTQILSSLDKKFGPVLRKSKTSVFVAKWQKELDRIDTIFENLEFAGKTDSPIYQDWKNKYQQIQEVIK
ncbi:tRNA (adenine(22)-N(1))-methyltransferase [Leuconostoc sp. JNUCC 76]